MPVYRFLQGAAAQRSILALELEPLIAAKAKEKEHERKSTLTTLSKSEEQINTRKEVAEMAGVSEGTLDKVKKVMKSGTEEVKQKTLNNICCLGIDLLDTQE